MAAYQSQISQCINEARNGTLVGPEKVHIISILDHVTKVTDTAFVDTAIAVACTMNNGTSGDRHAALVFFPTLHSDTTVDKVIKHHRVIEERRRRVACCATGPQQGRGPMCRAIHKGRVRPRGPIPMGLRRPVAEDALLGGKQDLSMRFALTFSDEKAHGNSNMLLSSGPVPAGS